MDDDDPVQFYWNDGNMYVMEKEQEEDDSSTGSDTSSDRSDTSVGTDEKRAFHV